MNYAKSLSYLAALGDELLGMKRDLQAITRVLMVLSNPHRRYPSAIVTGTNGKGSTSATLASILHHAGYKTGLYTSPHLVRVNERIRVNGQEVADDDFSCAFSEVATAVDTLLASKRLTSRPSYFEYLTASAFWHFAHVSVDFAVLEVGMGGRLDATNVVEPEVAVVTNVELDHTHILGSTIGEIAWEKAGIIKPHRPVISGTVRPEAAEVIRRRAAELDAEIIELSRVTSVTNERSSDGRYRFDLAIQSDGASEHFDGLDTPLHGRFQICNATAAIVAARRLSSGKLKIAREDIVEGLAETRWEGRLEPVRASPLVVLDGGHNPAAAREIALFIREQWHGRRVRMVYASMRDKDIGEISEILFPLVEEIYLTQPPGQARAATPEEILSAARFRPARVGLEPDPAKALARACDACAPGDVVLACGSLSLVGALKTVLARRRLPLLISV